VYKPAEDRNHVFWHISSSIFEGALTKKYLLFELDTFYLIGVVKEFEDMKYEIYTTNRPLYGNDRP